MAQPSLTRAIKQLEEELGGDLFRRERNLTHLTEFGQRMQPFLQQCFESAMAAKSLAKSLKSGAVAPLPIAVSSAVDLSILVPHLVELTRLFKGLELSFLRGNPAMIAEYLKMGDAELAISGPVGEAWERLEAWPLFTEPYRLVVGKENPIAASPSVRPEDLAKERHLYRTYCESREELQHFFDARNIKLEVSHKVVDEHDLIALLAANLGYVLAPPTSVQHSDAVRLIDVEGLDVTRTVSVYAVSGRQRSSAATALIKSLRAADWSAFEVEGSSVLMSKRA